MKNVSGFNTRGQALLTFRERLFIAGSIGFILLSNAVVFFVVWG